jgi:hypothetical protein
MAIPIQLKSAVLILMLAPMLSLAQTDIEPLTKKEIRKNRPSFISMSSGVSFTNFRDFATSPLIYNGPLAHFSISEDKGHLRRESTVGLSFATGNCSSIVNGHANRTALKSFSIHFGELFYVQKLSSGKWVSSAGGLLVGTGNFRRNAALQNNAVGFEIIPTLFGSMRITRDVSRTKERKFLFFKKKLKKKFRHLSCQLNLGLINSSYRNDYAYLGQGDVINEPKAFDRYQFKVFSGFRMSSALDYTVFMENRNKIRISYLWDAYKTGGDLDKLEMASHSIRITLLFNTNNK